jgi:hypothetical protein
MFKKLKGNSRVGSMAFCLRTRRRTIKHRLFLHTLIYNSTFKLIDNLLLMYSFKSENLFSHLASSQVHRPWSPCDLKWRLFLEFSGGHPGTLLTFRQKSITSLWLFKTLDEWICFELKKICEKSKQYIKHCISITGILSNQVFCLNFF